MNVYCYVVFGDDVNRYYDPLFLNINLSRNSEDLFFIATTSEYEAKVKSYFSQVLFKCHIEVFDDAFSKKYPKMLRYLAPFYVKGKVFLYKDSDSIITTREQKYTSQWLLNSQTQVLIFRDHPLHVSPIMGGLFSCRQDSATDLARMIISYGFKESHKYLYDQIWLSKYFYKKYFNDCSVYSSFFYYKNENVVFMENVLNDNVEKFMGYHSTASTELNKFSIFYAGKHLFLPYVGTFSKLYQKARLVLFLAKLYRLLNVFSSK